MNLFHILKTGTVSDYQKCCRSCRENKGYIDSDIHKYSRGTEQNNHQINSALRGFKGLYEKLSDVVIVILDFHLGIKMYCIPFKVVWL